MTVKNTNPTHPGKILEAIYMEDHNLNQSELAKKLGCAPNKINEIVRGKRGITPEFAIQLEEIFGLDAAVWVRMQAEYDVWLARRSVRKEGKRKRPASGISSHHAPEPKAASGAH